MSDDPVGLVVPLDPVRRFVDAEQALEQAWSALPEATRRECAHMLVLEPDGRVTTWHSSKPKTAKS